MKKLFAALILSVGLTPAWAEWVKISNSDSHDLYINFSSIVRSGDLARGWTLLNRRTSVAPGSAASDISLTQANCKSEQMRELQETYYGDPMGGGNVLRTYTTPTEWRYPTPGTLNAIIFRRLCNTR
jgi:hypothetical protein